MVRGFQNCNEVAVIEVEEVEYPRKPPFNPSDNYPEYTGEVSSTEDNKVYKAFRDMLYRMGLDTGRYNKQDWNPFGDIIKPSTNVVVKPNWVIHSSKGKSSLDCLVTNMSVIRAVIDYVIIALKGEGSITVIDTPIMNADFDLLCRQLGAVTTIDYLRLLNKNVDIQLLDGRVRKLKTNLLGGIEKDESIQLGNLVVPVDMKDESMLSKTSDVWSKYRVGFGSVVEMQKYHNSLNNIYLIRREILDADTVINVPKLKTHIKSGVTLSMKNCIGIIADKNCLPHHKRGGTLKGGDEYKGYNALLEIRPKVAEHLRKSGDMKWIIAKEAWKAIRFVARWHSKELTVYDVKSGSWTGNDTIWRTIFDVNTALYYADKSGNMKKEVQRNVIHIIDGVIAGEGDGPLHATDKPLGLLACSFNPIALDYICTMTMGYNPKQIKTLRSLFVKEKRLLGVNFKSSDVAIIGKTPMVDKFIEPTGWKGDLIC